MQLFINAVFKAGQATAVGDHIDMKCLVPFAKSIQRSISASAATERENIGEAVASGGLGNDGGINCDGVTLHIEDKNFYDIPLHCFDLCNGN